MKINVRNHFLEKCSKIPPLTGEVKVLWINNEFNKVMQFESGFGIYKDEFVWLTFLETYPVDDFIPFNQSKYAVSRVSKEDVHRIFCLNSLRICYFGTDHVAPFDNMETKAVLEDVIPIHKNKFRKSGNAAKEAFLKEKTEMIENIGDFIPWLTEPIGFIFCDQVV